MISSTGESGQRLALLLTGTVGAGKTTTAQQIGNRLGSAGVPHAVIDLDWLRKAWPPPEGDPFNLALELRNLAAVAQNFLDAGARRLVLAGVLEAEEARVEYEEALGVPLTVVRLRVGADDVRRRLMARHPPGEERDWHLSRSGELDRVLVAKAIGDAVIDVSGKDPAEVADLVLRAIGWA